ncbi:MAG: hypothetical protein AAFU60_14905 [Bacteroidota bacterium]
MPIITVDEALKKGHQSVNYPSMKIMFVGIGLSIYLGLKTVYWWIILPGMIGSFAGSWMWWSYSVTKWKIWAFQHCENVHELKRRAILEKLIWPDGHRFGRTAKISPEQQRQLDQLDAKFQQAEGTIQVEDDSALPDETPLFYSNYARFSEWLVGLGFLGGGGYLVLTKGAWYGYLLAFMSIPILKDAVQHLKRSAPLLILSTEGLQLTDGTSIDWASIAHAYTDIGSNRKGKTTWLLRIKLTNGDLLEPVDINDLSKRPKEIQTLLYVYQHRYWLQEQFR